MDPKNAKVGARFWVMLLGPSTREPMRMHREDDLLKLQPFEVIYLQPRTPAKGEDMMSCAIVDGGHSQYIHQDRLHELRVEAIQQAINDAAVRVRTFESAIGHYQAMIEDSIK